MDAIFKAVGKSPRQKPSPSSKAKHEKLADKWGEHKEPVKEGMTFYAKYLGSTLVRELEDEGESYGSKISAEAVRNVVTMAKASKKAPPKMAITISPGGIKVQNVTTKDIYTDMSIYRINFCTADKDHDRVFAYISRSTENETMECHCFECPKRKIAQAITLTVAQAFNIAKEDWEDKEQKERENTERRAFEGGSSRSGEDPFQTNSSESSNTMGFEDNFTDVDCFDMLAKSRSQGSQIKNNPFRNSGFHTGLHDDDIDEGLLQEMQGQGQGQGHSPGQQPEKPTTIDDLLLL